MNEAQALLQDVANGVPAKDWQALKLALIEQFKNALESFDSDDDMYDPITCTTMSMSDMSQEFKTLVEDLTETPCTVQRLAELLVYPHQQYAVTELAKYLSALIRTVRVSPSDGLFLDRDIDLTDLMDNARNINVELEDIEWYAPSEADNELPAEPKGLRDAEPKQIMPTDDVQSKNSEEAEAKAEADPV